MDEKRSGLQATTWDSIRDELKEVDDAWQAIETLVDRGCDRSELYLKLTVLCNIDRTIDEIKSWVGHDRRQLRATVKKIRASADLVSALNTSFYGILLEADQWSQLRTLPDVLTLYAGCLERWAKGFGPGKSWSEHAALFQLVHYVISTTTRPHDSEVAWFVSVLWHRPNYGADNQKAWRRAHYARFRAVHKQNHRILSSRIPPNLIGTPPPA